MNAGNTGHMPSVPLVSVVITTYNQAAYIGQTIQSALDQNYPVREIIVVDDGSTDGTPDVIARFENRIVSIRQKNRGVAGARNSGVAQARGHLVAFLDGDDLWEPGKLDAQVNAFREHPAAGLCAVDVRKFMGGDTIWTDTLRRFFSANEPLVARNVLAELARSNFIPTTSQVMIPADVLTEIGLSDDRCNGSSDYDLYLRVALRYQFVLVNRVLAHWRCHTTNTSNQKGMMLQSKLTTLSRLIATGVSDEVREAAEKHRNQTLLELANFEYECGHLDAARKIFAESGRLSGSNLFRYAATHLPRKFYPAIRSAWQHARRLVA